MDTIEIEKLIYVQKEKKNNLIVENITQQNAYLIEIMTISNTRLQAKDIDCSIKFTRSNTI